MNFSNRKISSVLTLALSSFVAVLFTAKFAFAQAAKPIDVTAIEEAICWLLYFEQGAYGALLAAVSGLSAIASAAMGSYRAALNCLIVCISLWLIVPVAELMFTYTYNGQTVNPVPSASVCQTRMQRVPTGGVN